MNYELAIMESLEYADYIWIDVMNDEEIDAALNLFKKEFIYMRLSGKGLFAELYKKH